MNRYVGHYFELKVNYYPRLTVVGMQMLTPTVNTRDYPLTYKILSARLPSIFRCVCFNKDNLPFEEELKNTEIGHLFEHILLEVLAEIKLYREERSVIFNGVTKWNWKRDQRGSFVILIDATETDKLIFELALKKSIKLLEKVLAG